MSARFLLLLLHGAPGSMVALPADRTLRFGPACTSWWFGEPFV